MNNDERILELQEKIALKREELGEEPQINLVTDDSIRMGDGSRIDLQIAPKATLISLLIDLNSRRLSANDLGIPYQIGEYLVEDWMLDIQAALKHLEYKQEYKRLESFEHQLEILLSEEKKKERKIEVIASQVQTSDD